MWTSLTTTANNLNPTMNYNMFIKKCKQHF